MKSVLKLSILALSLSSIGCSIGPVYKKPEVELPQSFQRNAEQMGSPLIAASDIDMVFWWENFKDPLLSELISISLRENNDLRKMLTRIDADTAFLKEIQRDIYPAVTMSGAVGHQHLSQNQAFGYKQSADVYRAGIELVRQR